MLQVVGQLRKIRKGLRQDDTGNDGLHSAKKFLGEALANQGVAQEQILGEIGQRRALVTASPLPHSRRI
jgi:hypothetical protein